MRARMILVAALGLLAACREQPGPGELTAEDQRQLDEAAAMLDSSETTPPAPELQTEAMPANAQ